MSTSAGWDGVLDGIINEEDCQEPNNEIGYPGNCGSSTIGIAYLLSYLVISFLIVINMYIAVILENYSQATEDVQEGLTDDDYDMYYEIWQQFDPDGTQYIRYSSLLKIFMSFLKIITISSNVTDTTNCRCSWTCWSRRCRYTSQTSTKSYRWTYQYAKETSCSAWTSSTRLPKTSSRERVDRP